VLLDMVYLHCGPKPVFLAEHPDFFKRDKDGKAVNAAWAFPGLDFKNPELREYLWKNMEWWIRDFDADGFRCDVADGIPLDFWETGRARIEAVKPDVGMLAEGTRKEDQLKAFDLDYGWGKAYRTWDNAAEIRSLWEKMVSERPRGGAKFARFIDNHDIANDDYGNRVEKRWGGARVEAALAALFTLDGVPFLYNGQEVADTARHSIFGRLPIDWDGSTGALARDRFTFIQKLCALRKAEPALTKGGLTWLDSDAPQAVLSFTRTFGSDRIAVYINLTDKAAEVGRQSPAATALLERGVSAPFTLAPHGFYIGKRR
jgi:glycosidase